MPTPQHESHGLRQVRQVGGPVVDVQNELGRARCLVDSLTDPCPYGADSRHALMCYWLVWRELRYAHVDVVERERNVIGHVHAHARGLYAREAARKLHDMPVERLEVGIARLGALPVDHMAVVRRPWNITELYEGRVVIAPVVEVDVTPERVRPLEVWELVRAKMREVCHKQSPL